MQVIFKINSIIMRSVVACWVLLLLTSCGPGTFLGTWSDVLSKHGQGGTGQTSTQAEPEIPDGGSVVSAADPALMRLYAEEGRGVWLVNERAGLAHTIIGLENRDNGLLTVRETGPLTGLAVAAGDLNGDGRDDLILGAPESDGPLQGATASGWVYVVFGREQFPEKLDLRDAGPLSLWAGRSAGRNRLGQALITADLNGDGLSDVIIGAPHASPHRSRDDETMPVIKAHAGSVFVLYGRRDWAGVSQASRILDLSQRADVVIHGASEGDLTGFALATGDVNGDHRQDLLIGAPGGRGDGDSGRQAGLTYVIYGRAQFPRVLQLSETWDSRIHGVDGSGTRLTLTKNRPDRSGSSLAAGDVNADGIDDVVIGAPSGDGWSNEREDAGECYVVFGHAALPRELPLRSRANVIIYGTEPFARAGHVVTIGDLNHDGVGDVVIGSSKRSRNADGAKTISRSLAHIVYGGPGLAPTFFLDRAQVIQAPHPGIEEMFGASLAHGDFDGDGRSDFLVGAPGLQRPTRTLGVFDSRRPVGGAYLFLGKMQE